jgi:hypothetical protein
MASVFAWLTRAITNFVLAWRTFQASNSQKDEGSFGPLVMSGRNLSSAVLVSKLSRAILTGIWILSRDGRREAQMKQLPTAFRLSLVVSFGAQRVPVRF